MMISVMNIDSVDPYSRVVTEALKVVLVDRMDEIAQKRCYICDGFGHSVQVCPTAPIVRNIATLATLPKVKRCVTAGITSAKIRNFMEVKARWTNDFQP